MATALVTGATAGIGYSYAQLLAKEGFDLVLVARDLPRMNKVAKELSKTFGVKVECLKADLTMPIQLAKVEKRLASTVKPIEVLINNAGFGIKDSFVLSSVAEEQELLDVLVTAPMRLTHAVLPGMVKRDSGVIVNVSSVASFIAGGTYSAAKSYLTVFSEYLHTELRETNIRVSALCPGFTRTEFHKRANMPTDSIPNWMWISTNLVVKDSIKAVLKGKAVVIPHIKYKLMYLLLRNLPRFVVRKFSNSYQSRRQ